jgi:nucleoredoxin
MSSVVVDWIGSTLVSGKGKTSVPTSDALSGKLVAFYFSAHWCPPCRQFTPLLNSIYLGWQKESKPIEIVFVSSDQDDESFSEYFDSMDFKAIPFSDEEKRQALGEKFGIRGIPALIVVDESGNIRSKDGRADVMKSKAAALDQWQAAK